MNLILASKSKRRHYLLKKLTKKFTIIDSAFDENNVKIKDPKKYCQKLATSKAQIKSNPQEARKPLGSYWITTFGCQMNKADSERIAGILEAMGYIGAKKELEADLVLYNT